MGAADRSNLFTLDSPGIPGAAELWLPSDLVAWCELDSCQHIMPVAPPEETPASSPRITSLTEPEPGSEPPLSPAAVEPPLPHHLAAVAGSSSSRPAAPRGASQPRAPQALPPPTEPHQEVEEMNQRFGGALSISAPTTAAGWGGASRRLGSPLQGRTAPRRWEGAAGRRRHRRRHPAAAHATTARRHSVASCRPSR